MDLDTRYNQRITENIEAQLMDIDRRYKIKDSPEDKKKLMSEERDNIVMLARTVLANRGKIPALEAMYGWISNTLLQFLGFDPFKLLYFEEYDHNSQFANRAFSNPSLFDAMEQAGQILMEKQSTHLKPILQHFYQRVASAKDVEKAADIIIGFCKCLPPFARNGNSLLTKADDVKQLLMDSIKLMLQSEVSQERLERQYSCPLILPTGELTWVHYDFVSYTSVEKHFIFGDKVCDLDVIIRYYYFPNESEFRQALRRIEQDDKTFAEYFEEYAPLCVTNRASSNPSLIHALEHAGRILEEKQSPELNRKHWNCKHIVTLPENVDIAANEIIDVCKCLPSARNGHGLLINVNDVSHLLMESVKLLLTSEERCERLYSYPIVLASGELCWVKYKFVSEKYVSTERCCYNKKICDFDVTILYYWFQSESDFRQELRRIERDN